MKADTNDVILLFNFICYTVIVGSRCITSGIIMEVHFSVSCTMVVVDNQGSAGMFPVVAAVVAMASPFSKVQTFHQSPLHKIITLH